MGCLGSERHSYHMKKGLAPRGAMTTPSPGTRGSAPQGTSDISRTWVPFGYPVCGTDSHSPWAWGPSQCLCCPHTLKRPLCHPQSCWTSSQLLLTSVPMNTFHTQKMLLNLKPSHFVSLTLYQTELQNQTDQ